MTLYALDTDTLTLFQDGDSVVSGRCAAQSRLNLSITVITVEEQLSGWYAQLRQAKKPEKLAWAYRRLAENVRFLSQLRVLDFDNSAIRRYEALRKQKLKLGTLDLRIAATVLEHGATLVTCNTRDFGKVPGLLMEDWSK